ncbi:response regulator [Candidatus Aerophobetes bacterium]|nr:response regulator [Candidatus Aerophobetes bacterium]
MTINKEKVNILVAEDEADLRDILKVTLEQEGYRAILASDGDEAIKKIEKKSFQMALIDIKMPGVNGKELVFKIKQINPLMPIVIVTGSPDFKEEVSLKKQVYEYIYKPFRLNELVRVVKEALRQT